MSVRENASMFVGFVECVRVCMWERVGSAEQGRATTVKDGKRERGNGEKKGKGWGRCRDSELDRIIGLSFRIIFFPAQFIPVQRDGFVWEEGLQFT